MDGITIKVTTEVLVEVSGDLTAKVTKAQNTFQKIEEIINRTPSYWEGNGQRQMAVGYSKRSDDFNRIFNEIREHARRLNEIAGVYQLAETAAGATAEMLPEDIIF